MSVTATASLRLTYNDIISGQFTKNLGTAFVGDSSTSASGVLIGTSPVDLAIPGESGEANFVYIKNLSGSASLDVTWTPNGGDSAEVIQLPPGSIIALFQPEAGNGITAIRLQASLPDTPVEYVLVGGPGA